VRRASGLSALTLSTCLVASAAMMGGPASAETLPATVPAGVADVPADAIPATFEFTHPGLLNSRAELDLVKARIKAGEEPWSSQFADMKNSHHGSQTWTPHPVAVVHSNGKEAWEEQDDAIAAYTLALLWYFTDDEAYAAKSVEILDGWSSVLIEHTSTDRQKELVAAWAGSVFPLAGEILRASYPKWTSGQIAQFSTMLDRAFVPLLLRGNPTYNGNWELSMANALLSIGVFNDDAATFNRGVFLWRRRVPAYFYLASDGPTPIRPFGTDKLDADSAINKYWFSPHRYFDGLCQETQRDYGEHMQMGLASAVNSAEIAFHQGLDLYGENDGRIMAAMEFQAARLLGKPAPPELFPNGFPAADLRPTWEIAYNHFHNRKGRPLPQTEELIRAQLRPSQFRTMLNMAWETLTHGELDAERAAADVPD
jgi:hypothetical protein